MIFHKTSYTQSNYAFPLPYFKAKACLARNRQCSREYAHLRIDVASTQKQKKKRADRHVTKQTIWRNCGLSSYPCQSVQHQTIVRAKLWHEFLSLLDLRAHELLRG